MRRCARIVNTHKRRTVSMSSTNVARRRKIRALEAKRDSLREKKDAAIQQLKVVAAELKHAKGSK